jgi:hypothetical protein
MSGHSDTIQLGKTIMTNLGGITQVTVLRVTNLCG